MPTNTERKERTARLRDRLTSGERGGCDADRDVLLRFSDRMKLLRETYSWSRHEKLLRHCVRFSEQAPPRLVDTLDNRAAAEQIVRWVHDEYDLDETPETNKDYRVALRVFGKRLGDTDRMS